MLASSYPGYQSFHSSLEKLHSIDNYVIDIAKKYKKEIRNIEKDDALIRSINSISQIKWQTYVSEAIAMRECDECMHNFITRLTESYVDNDDYNYMHNKIKSAYSMQPEMFSIYEDIFFKLRNHEIVKTIISSQAEQAPCDVIVIGAGHFGGSDGLVNLLSAQGMSIEWIK